MNEIKNEIIELGETKIGEYGLIAEEIAKYAIAHGRAVSVEIAPATYYKTLGGFGANRSESQFRVDIEGENND